MSTESTSVSLLGRLRESNTDADWLRFANLYTPLLYYWGRSQGLNSTDTADLVQEVMAKLVVKLRDFRYDPKLTFRGWLRTIAINQARDMRRAQSREATGLIQTLDQEPVGENPIDLFECNEYSNYLVARGRELIRSEFEAVTWNACWRFAVEGRSAAEVGAELGLSANAVRIAKYRVVARLRKELEGLLQ